MLLLVIESPWWTLLGRLHPLLLHFPIALATCAAVIALGRWILRRDEVSSPIVGFCLWTALITGMAAAWSGWTLAEALGDGSLTESLHRWFAISGLGVIATACVLRILKDRRGGRYVPASLIATVMAGATMATAGHFGGTMLWGKGWVLAPLLQAMGMSASDDEELADTESSVDEELVEAEPQAPQEPPWTAVAQVFDTNCSNCHGPDRQKSRLQLVPLPVAYGGRSDPPPIVAGHTDMSSLLGLISAHPDSDARMPPKGDMLSSEDVETVRSWIAAGCPSPPASTNAVAASKPPPLPPAPIATNAAAARAAIESRGGYVQYVSGDSGPLEVNLSHATPPADDTLLAQLAPLAASIIWLDLSESSVTDAGMEHLRGMLALETLRLDHTAVGDNGLAALAGLPDLRSINLYGTPVTDSCRESLASMESLRRCYLGQTAMTSEGINALRNARSDVRIVWSGAVPPEEPSSS